MMKDNGGYAFPHDVEERNYNVYGEQTVSHYSDAGMTLRDYFAAKAMQGILTNQGMIDNVTPESAKWVAREAYQVADAMLEARNK